MLLLADIFNHLIHESWFTAALIATILVLGSLIAGWSMHDATLVSKCKQLAADLELAQGHNRHWQRKLKEEKSRRMAIIGTRGAFVTNAKRKQKKG
jgi:hypothetical protein